MKMNKCRRNPWEEIPRRNRRGVEKYLMGTIKPNGNDGMIPLIDLNYKHFDRKNVMSNFLLKKNLLLTSIPK